MAKKHKSSEAVQSFWKWFSFLVLITSIAFAYSTSPRFHAPVLDERKDISELPSEYRQVLGSKTEPNAKKTVSLKIPILMYHYVEYVADPGDKIRISLNIPPSVFENQVKTLQDAGYTFLTASEFDDIIGGKMKVPQKPVLLTFDDGYRDFYTDAYPILKKYNVKATQYVIAGFLDRPNHLLTSQLKEIADDRLVEIGAHTMDHVWLRGLDKKTVTYQVEQSKKDLESITGLPVTSFAYPYGAFDQQAIDIVSSAGFRDAVTTVPGVLASEDNKYFLYRLRPGYRVGDSLISYISSDTFAAAK